MKDFSIRELKKEDISAAESILIQHWSGDFMDHMLQRAKDFTNHLPSITEQEFRYLVAERDGEIVGIAAYRAAPEHMREYVTTDNPAEFYILAVKYKRQGIGSALRTARIEEVKDLGYTEIVLYGGETHQDSWPFHDNSEFKRAGPMVAPNGEPGIIWRIVLNQ